MSLTSFLRSLEPQLSDPAKPIGDQIDSLSALELVSEVEVVLDRQLTSLETAQLLQLTLNEVLKYEAK